MRKSSLFVPRNDNKLTVDDIQERIDALHKRFEDGDDIPVDDEVCYWFGYQDGLSGIEWIGGKEHPVTWANLNDVANSYDNPDFYRRGFEDAKGDMELWDDTTED